jgi:hypothetical protein
MAGRDRAASGRPRGGRGTTRYVLAKLARCAACGSPMYCSTSPQRRKEGTRARRYICANVKFATGVCDASHIDAEPVDRQFIALLSLYLIDVEAWNTVATRAPSAQVATIEDAVNAAVAAVRALDAQIARLEDRFAAQHILGGRRDPRRPRSEA